MRVVVAPLLERHPIFNSRDTEEARAFLHEKEIADLRSGLDAPISGRWGGLSSGIWLPPAERGARALRCWVRRASKQVTDGEKAVIISRN